MAHVDYFLKIDGVDGESTDAKHKGEIEVESFSWGVTQTSTRSGGGAGTGRAVFQDFHFTAPVSKPSPTLFLKCASGEHIKQAVLTASTTSEKGQPQEFIKVTLSDVLVSSYQSGGATASTPDDSVALHYATLQFREGPQQRINVTPAATGVLRYDAATNSYEVVESPDGLLVVGSSNGAVSRGVQEFDISDIRGLLGAPFGTAKLRLLVSEVREAATPPTDVATILSEREGPSPHMRYDVLLYTPADLELSPEDLTRKGERLGTLDIDPRNTGPASLDLDLSSLVSRRQLSTFGLRIQLRGAPVIGHPPDPGHEQDDEREDEEDDTPRLGRQGSASFTLELIFDTR